MTWECFLPLCPAPAPLCGPNPTAPGCTPPAPRLQETDPGSGSSFRSALQSRAALTARSSPPPWQAQPAGFPLLRHRGAPSADAPTGGTGPPAPNPAGENSPRRRRPAAPRARRQEGTAGRAPLHPPGPRPARTFPGAEVTRTHPPSARRPARPR